MSDDYERYTVREVRGCGCGLGMFTVVDNEIGCDVGSYKYFRDECEQQAARLNRVAATVQEEEA